VKKAEINRCTGEITGTMKTNDCDGEIKGDFLMGTGKMNEYTGSMIVLVIS
jgi:hypothetical protein